MPLALLLHDQLGIITQIVTDMAPLARTFDRAAEIVRRRRGAFLAHWFGERLPFDRGHLAVGVVNADAIRARVLGIRAAQQRYTAERLGPNLVEPVAGMAGVLVGGVLSLGFGLVLAAAVLGGTIYLVYRGLRALWDLVTGARPAAGSAPGLSLRALHEMGFTGAAWGEALTAVGRAIVDPRSTRDPVWRATLALLDRLAGLIAQALGAVSTFLHLVPVAKALGGAVAPLQRLADVAGEIIGKGVKTAIDAVQKAIKASGVHLVPAMVRRALRTALRRAHILIRAGVAGLRVPFRTLAQRVNSVWAERVQPVLDHIDAHPLVRLVRSVGDVSGPLSQLADSFKALFPAIGMRLIPPTIKKVASIVGGLLSRIGVGGGGSTTPPTPSTPGFLDKLVARATPPTPTLPPRAKPTDDIVKRALADLALRPLSIVAALPRVFPAERARLVARWREVYAEPSYQTAQRILLGAARVAGPAVEHEVRSLAGRIDALEAKIRGRQRLPHPTLRVPEPRRIQPVFRRVRVTGSADRSGEQLRAWVDTVLGQVAASPVPVPARS